MTYSVCINAGTDTKRESFQVMVRESFQVMAQVCADLGVGGGFGWVSQNLSKINWCSKCIPDITIASETKLYDSVTDEREINIWIFFTLLQSVGGQFKENCYKNLE